MGGPVGFNETRVSGVSLFVWENNLAKIFLSL